MNYITIWELGMGQRGWEREESQRREAQRPKKIEDGD